MSPVLRNRSCAAQENGIFVQGGVIITAEINLSVFWFLFTAGLQSKIGGCVNFDGETLENTGTFHGNNF